jgi:hypothetical protein
MDQPELVEWLDAVRVGWRDSVVGAYSDELDEIRDFFLNWMEDLESHIRIPY